VVAANFTVALTYASGAIFGREMLRALEADQRESLTEVARAARIPRRRRKVG
jgi:3-polyprenyl-4-hydroxybenzoate decarboxylase